MRLNNREILRSFLSLRSLLLTLGGLWKRSDQEPHLKRHADWLSESLRLSRVSHKYPALVMTVESDFVHRRCRSVLLLGQKWKSSPSLSHPLVKTHARLRICNRMLRFRGQRQRQTLLQLTTWVVISRDNTVLYQWAHSPKLVMSKFYSIL